MSEEIFVYDDAGNFTSENSIAIVWHIDDVKQAARDIGLAVPDDETCMGILYSLYENHDANYGITWKNFYDELRQLNEENDNGEV
jgi:hypothetical protein